MAGVDNKTYSLIAGVSLLAASVIFFALPELLDYDAFLPVILSLVFLMGALAVFFSGLGGRS